MKISAIVLISMLVTSLTPALANAQRNNQGTGEDYSQMEKERQACEGDVYALCGDAIPNVDRIIACLRLRWKNVSRECRAIMVSHSRSPNIRRGQR
jgi:hypothetical protein